MTHQDSKERSAPLPPNNPNFIVSSQHLLQRTAASCSARQVRVSATSNGRCTNSPVALLSTSTGCRPKLTPRILTAAALPHPMLSRAPSGPMPPVQKRAATAALCAWCSTKLLMCAGGRLLQCSRGASSSTLVRSAANSACWLGWLGPAAAVLQPAAPAQPVDSRQSACSTCSQWRAGHATG